MPMRRTRACRTATISISGRGNPWASTNAECMSTPLDDRMSWWSSIWRWMRSRSVISACACSRGVVGAAMPIWIGKWRIDANWNALKQPKCNRCNFSSFLLLLLIILLLICWRFRVFLFIDASLMSMMLKVIPVWEYQNADIWLTETFDAYYHQSRKN